MASISRRSVSSARPIGTLRDRRKVHPKPHGFGGSPLSGLAVGFSLFLTLGRH